MFRLYRAIIKPFCKNRPRLVDWYCGYEATTQSHLGRKLGPLCTAFSSARRPQRRSTSSDMRALW